MPYESGLEIYDETKGNSVALIRRPIKMLSFCSKKHSTFIKSIMTSVEKEKKKDNLKLN